jgi:hypothetical protein
VPSACRSQRERTETTVTEREPARRYRQKKTQAGRGVTRPARVSWSDSSSVREELKVSGFIVPSRRRRSGMVNTGPLSKSEAALV